MSNTYKSVNMDAVAGNGGGSGTPYILPFLTGTWNLNSSVYEINYLATTHLKGATVSVQVFEKAGAIYKEVTVDIELNTSGDVKITIPSVTDLRFEGKIIILGE